VSRFAFVPCHEIVEVGTNVYAPERLTAPVSRSTPEFVSRLGGLAEVGPNRGARAMKNNFTLS
jgi:hypothetical protein